MFKHFGNKKRREKKPTLSVNEISQLTDEQKAELHKKIEADLEKLNNAQADERIRLLNELGESYQRIGDVDKAIEYFEMSIGEKKAFGAAYHGLLKLYEIRRKEAAKTKNDDQIQLYVNKLDNLMQISKDVMRGNI